MRKIYDEANSFVKPEAIPSMVLSIAEYQYKAAFVADQEVNLVACLTTLMAECDFK
jgi:replication factor C small subunit